MYVTRRTCFGLSPLRDAFNSWKERRLEIDSLMLIAAAGAAALGAWAEGALLLFLFSLGAAEPVSRWGGGRQSKP